VECLAWPGALDIDVEVCCLGMWGTLCGDGIHARANVPLGDMALETFSSLIIAGTELGLWFRVMSRVFLLILSGFLFMHVVAHMRLHADWARAKIRTLENAAP
jgi:hypothetical protein